MRIGAENLVSAMKVHGGLQMPACLVVGVLVALWVFDVARRSGVLHTHSVMLGTILF